MLKNPFLIELKQKYMDAFSKCNGGAPFEKKEWEFNTKAGNVEVNVSRGDVFEKVCVSTILSRVVIPGRDFQSTIQWLGLQAFSSNPLVPMYMAAFEQVEEENEDRFPCYFDVYPAVAIDEDKGALSDALGGVCKKYDRTYPDLPEGYLKMFQLEEAGTGVGYGVGMALKPTELNFEFYKEVASTIHQSYFDIVDKRKDESPSQEDKDALNKFRAEWTRFVFMENRFFAGGVKLGVPVEAFMLHMLPPSVKF